MVMAMEIQQNHDVPYGAVSSMSTCGGTRRTRRQRSAPKRYINEIEGKVERLTPSSSSSRNKKPKVDVQIKSDPDDNNNNDNCNNKNNNFSRMIRDLQPFNQSGKKEQYQPKADLKIKPDPDNSNSNSNFFDDWGQGNWCWERDYNKFPVSFAPTVVASSSSSSSSTGTTDGTMIITMASSNAARKKKKVKKGAKGITKRPSSLPPPPPPRECIMCIAHGRQKMKCEFGYDQFIPILLKRKDCSTEKIPVGYNHVCCAIRAQPQKNLNEKETPEWWRERSEITHGYPGLIESRFDSTSTTTATNSNSNSTTKNNNDNYFVPYSMSFEDWMDEFCVYNYRMLLGSVRRFKDGRGPPYNIVGSTAALWRCDDRGSIGYARMVQDLTERASATKDRRLTQAEAALWGAITYRTINRLSTFSRWAAIKKLSKDEGKSISELIDQGLYETAIHGDDNVGTNRNEDLHAIAASGVTLLGRMGYRDKWGKDFCIQQMESVSPMCCISQLPLPSELNDFKKFTDWEKLTMGRGVMTGEHQVQPYETIMSVLKKLAANNCSQLKKMSKVVMGTDSAKVVLDELKELPMVADFFAWQIFSDLVCVQYYCQLFPDNTILPSSVVDNSRFNYGLFGPGARKGAYIIFGGGSDLLANLKQNVSQLSTIPRAVIIRNEFQDALIRTKLDKSWAERANGRIYDLETVEHSLCGFYGVMHNLNVNILASDEKASKEMEKIAKNHDCVWPPGSDKSSSNKIQQRQGMGRWKPHPCTTLERQDLMERCNRFKATATTTSTFQHDEKYVVKIPITPLSN